MRGLRRLHFPDRMNTVPPKQRWVTNFGHLRTFAPSPESIEETSFSADGSWADTWRMFQSARRSDAVVLNIASIAVLKLCLLRLLMPWARFRLISVDILLARPENFRHRLLTPIKKFLLRQVDLFILYFHDLADYDRYFGIGPDRAHYVPFKSNSWEKLPPGEQLSNDGEYIFTAGRTMRDLKTFVEAMRRVPYPAVLMHLKGENIEHGTQVPRDSLPANITLLEHDGNRATWIERMRRAKIVVIPILPTTISSSGIGTSIDAMAMRKFIVITDGQSTRGLITDQAMVVPAQDPAAMAAAIRQGWEDPALRVAYAERGRRHAEALAGEERLHRDVARVTADYVARARR
jgi:glycosyltransferase involved in cell wall biosynthesis